MAQGSYNYLMAQFSKEFLRKESLMGLERGTGPSLMGKSTKASGRRESWDVGRGLQSGGLLTVFPFVLLNCEGQHQGARRLLWRNLSHVQLPALGHRSSHHGCRGVGAGPRDLQVHCLGRVHLPAGARSREACPARVRPRWPKLYASAQAVGLASHDMCQLFFPCNLLACRIKP